MDQKTIDRINELARKAKTVGLTPEEKAEIQQFCLSTGYSLLELIRLGIKSAQK